MRPGLRPIGDDVAALVRAARFIAFDFDGVFTDNTVMVLEDGREAVTCWRSDGLGLRRVEALGVMISIVSTEVNPVVSARARKLKMPCVQGCEDKLASLKVVCAERGVSLAETAFVGNDINDEECLRAVGLPIVVRDAHVDVRNLGRYRTLKVGGRGAVREVCDLFVAVRSSASP